MGAGAYSQGIAGNFRYDFEELGMRQVWCSHYDGNIKRRYVMEKLGFMFHHTTEEIELELLGEVRTGHALLLTRENGEEINKEK